MPGVSESLVPNGNLMWSNAVPDAESDVDFTIDGVPVQFRGGLGYHDKNFADTSIVQSTHRFWDWGHARAGPYSVTWFVVTEKDNTTHPHAYVAKDGEPLLVACGADEPVQVRQWGGQAAWPPKAGLNDVDGLEIRYKLPGEEQLVLNVTKTLVVLDEGVHQRANGVVQGGIEGCTETYEGYAHFEEYIIGIVNP